MAYGEFQRVVVDGEKNHLRFLLFINDIHENLDSILRLFADDALLYSSINTMNDSVILQNDIDKLVSWSKV